MRRFPRLFSVIAQSDFLLTFRRTECDKRYCSCQAFLLVSMTHSDDRVVRFAEGFSPQRAQSNAEERQNFDSGSMETDNAFAN